MTGLYDMDSKVSSAEGAVRGGGSATEAVK